MSSSITTAPRRPLSSLPSRPPPTFTFLSVQWVRSQPEIAFKEVEKALKTKLRQDMNIKGECIRKVYEYDVGRSMTGEGERGWEFRFVVELDGETYSKVVDLVNSEGSANLTIVPDELAFVPPPLPTPPPPAPIAVPTLPPPKKPLISRPKLLKSRSTSAVLPHTSTSPSATGARSPTPVLIASTSHPSADDWLPAPVPPPPPVPPFAFTLGSPPLRTLEYNNSPLFACSEASNSSHSPASPLTPYLGTPADLPDTAYVHLSSHHAPFVPTSSATPGLFSTPTPGLQQPIKIKFRTPQHPPPPTPQSISHLDPSTSLPIIRIDSPPHPAPSSSFPIIALKPKKERKRKAPSEKKEVPKRKKVKLDKLPQPELEMKMEIEGGLASPHDHELQLLDVEADGEVESEDPGDMSAA